jgi:hypothetical protein
MAKYVFIRRERVFNESDEQMMHYVREVAPSVEKPVSAASS